MPKEKNYKWKLGGFSIFILAIAIGGIYVVGKQKNKFGDVFHISAIFKSVSGLKAGGNVRFGGIDVGTVDGIELITDTSVRVDMIIQGKVQKFIKKDAQANISSDGLMGDKVIMITPGTNGQPTVAEGEILQARIPVETDQIMASLKASADNAVVITANLADIVDRVNHGKGALGKLLHDTTLSTNISSTMKNLKKSSEGLNENMEAAKHSFLLKGYFKKKDKEKQKKADSLKKAGEDKKN